MVNESARETRELPALSTQPDEFEAFYREHLPFLRSYLARRLDDPGLVADLTADVFVQVIRSAETYRAKLGPPRAWLTGIAQNVLADHHRSTTRDDTTFNRLTGRRLLDDDSIDRIVQRITAEAQARSVLAAIAQLPDALRDVVELIAVDELPVTEAAAVLGITAGAARVRYHRARRALQATPLSQLLEVTI